VPPALTLKVAFAPAATVWLCGCHATLGGEDKHMPATPAA